MMRPPVMSPRVLAALAVCALAACSPSPPPTTVQGRCQQQANDDPAVKAIQVQAPTFGSDPAWQASLQRARRNAVSACLSAAGIAQPGGVEPVGRARYGAGWF